MVARTMFPSPIGVLYISMIDPKNMYTYIELFPSPIGVLYISMRDTVANELERDFRPLLEFFIFQ